MTDTRDMNEFERWLDIWRGQHRSDEERIQAAAAEVSDVMRLALASVRSNLLGGEFERESPAAYQMAATRPEIVAATVEVCKLILQRADEKRRGAEPQQPARGARPWP